MSTKLLKSVPLPYIFFAKDGLIAILEKMTMTSRRQAGLKLTANPVRSFLINRDMGNIPVRKRKCA